MRPNRSADQKNMHLMLGTRTVARAVRRNGLHAAINAITAKRKRMASMTSGGDKPRLLVVEDDPALAQALALGLSRRGFNVAQATNGQTALDRACSEPFAAIVLDLTLPELDGLEVLRGMRSKGIGHR